MSAIEQLPVDKDILRVVERCLDVLLTPREENHKTARLVAEGLSMPRYVVSDPLDDMCPNCVTPWKCNGPHLIEHASSCGCSIGFYDGFGKGHEAWLLSRVEGCERDHSHAVLKAEL